MGTYPNELQRGMSVKGVGGGWGLGAGSPSSDRKGRNSFLFLPAALMSQTDGTVNQKKQQLGGRGSNFPTWLQTNGRN